MGVLTECDNIFTHENLTLLRELGNELMDSVSYADKITSLTDIEFMVGDEWGMTIEQIVPDEIPDDGTPEMDEIRRKAYSKPNVAKKLVSKDGTMSWVVLKLRAFPEDSIWRQETDVAPDMQTGEEVERVLNNPKYAKLNPKGTGMPVVSYEKMEFINEEMSRLMMIACIICLVVMIVMTKSLRGVVSPFIAVIGGMFITYGIAGYTGMYVDSTTTLIPVILGFAVSIAYNIHLFSPVMGGKEHTHMGTFRISKSLLNNTLSLQSFAYLDLTDGGIYNRFTADYALNDQMHVMVGYDLFHADKGMFLMYADNSEYWLKLKYSF